MNLKKQAGRGAAILLMACCLAACVSNGAKVAGTADADGRTYYPDLPESPRIQHLTTLASESDLAGEEDGFARFILGEEKKETRLVQPYGTAMDKGRLYVVDTGAGALAVFDLARKKLEFIPGSGSGRMKRPINIRIDRDGTRYVTDTGRDQVMVYDRNDRFVLAIGESGQFRPVDLAIVGERLYVVDILHHSIQVLEKATGKLLFHFGKAGSGDGELFHPTNIAVTPEGDMLVVDTSNYRVQRFSADGKFIRSHGTVGATPGSFARPKGIAVDPSGRMYVSDAAFENVQLFDREGRLLMYFGQPGDGKEGLNLPTGVTIDRENIEWFRRYARKGFDIEYLIFVASQFGPNKIDVFGFGKLQGKDYPAEEGVRPAQKADRR
jgi:sugar lactone lactonase YvrE